MPIHKRVLCVDDNLDICALITESLKEWDVIPEHTVGEGLRRAATENFDLILLDYHLPDGIGLDLCRQVRLFNATTPILMVTVTHSIEHDEVLAAGGQGVIRKDHLIHVLPAAIASALELTAITP
jgi:DNA-binding response OmpR family regulator